MKHAWCALALLAACDDGPRYWVCDELPTSQLHELPKTLSETGLSDPQVIAYEPRFPLWSDGAEKKRWLTLPAGARIDSTDMDAWQFPEGTQFWKEFTRDGVRVETRLLQKVGPREGDWVALAYLWDDDQREARAAPWGVIDAHGTPHNVPAASECTACHGGTHSHVLGFSALQLGGSDTLRSLVAQNLLTAAPTELAVALPGTPVEQAALGYLHANCSHCHNQTRPPIESARCFAPENKLDFHLSVNALGSTADTATYRSMGEVVKRGHPNRSKLFELISRRGFFDQMPPLATERVDQEAVATMRAWIEAL